MNKSRVFVRTTRSRPLHDVAAEVLERLDWRELVQPNAKVVIKLNLNTADPMKIESANTSPALVESICRHLMTRTSDIALVESHAYRHTAQEAFEICGMIELAKRLGIKVVNLSEAPCRDVGHALLGPLPEILLDADVFMTMPVIKTHALTYFTGSLKNQWGCLPSFDRISLHYALDQLIVDLNRILRPRLSIMDGIIGVEGRGPTNGDPRRLDIVLGCRDPVALDAAAMRLVGLEPSLCRHVQLAVNAGLGQLQPGMIDVDMDCRADWEPFVPAKMDWAVGTMNRLSRYRWFRKGFLEVKPVFEAGKRTVGLLRRLGIVR